MGASLPRRSDRTLSSAISTTTVAAWERRSRRTTSQVKVSIWPAYERRTTRSLTRTTPRRVMNSTASRSTVPCLARSSSWSGRHVPGDLATRHSDVIGIDLSPRMIEVAKQRAPDIAFEVGSMLQLPATDDAWAGAIALYSTFTAPLAAAACRQLRPSAPRSVAFHIDSAEIVRGERPSIVPVDIVMTTRAGGRRRYPAGALPRPVIRQPWPDVEYPSRRCYLLAQRR